MPHDSLRETRIAVDWLPGLGRPLVNPDPFVVGERTELRWAPIPGSGIDAVEVDTSGFPDDQFTDLGQNDDGTYSVRDEVTRDGQWKYGVTVVRDGERIYLDPDGCHESGFP